MDVKKRKMKKIYGESVGWSTRECSKNESE